MFCFFSNKQIGFQNEKGFSMVELLVVLAIATIMTGFSIFYLTGHQKLYKPDEESLKLVDLLQEARQRSLTQRETMRVEIDLDDSVARLIDENTPTVSSDDSKIREVTLFPGSTVKLDSRPPDINTFPSESMPVPIAQFTQSVYPSSITHNVCTFRFLRNGTVVNAGTNPIGDNSTLTGATLFIWSPKEGSTTTSEIARAITVVGATGSIRFWEYNRSSTDANKWKDSKRISNYGGQAGNSNSGN